MQPLRPHSPWRWAWRLFSRIADGVQGVLVVIGVLTIGMAALFGLIAWTLRTLL